MSIDDGSCRYEVITHNGNKLVLGDFTKMTYKKEQFISEFRDKLNNKSGFYIGEDLMTRLFYYYATICNNEEFKATVSVADILEWNVFDCNKEQLHNLNYSIYDIITIFDKGAKNTCVDYVLKSTILYKVRKEKEYLFNEV